VEQEDVISDIPDNDGRTPLSWATRNGCDGRVKLLLERGDVSPDREGNYGKGPFLLAVMYRYREVVRSFKVRMSAAPCRV